MSSTSSSPRRPRGGSSSLFGGGGSSGQQQDEGAGVVYNNDGYILTDQHVVAGATSIKVTFQDGYVAPAKLIGTDPSTDVGVIKVDAPASELHPLTFADSSTRPGRRRRRRDRQPVQPARDGHLRDRQSQTGRSITGAERLDDPRRDPDRRTDQPGQLGRSAAQRQRRGARPQRPDRDQQHHGRRRGFELRHRLRDPRQRGPEGRQHDHLRQAGRARLRRRLAGTVDQGWRQDRVAGSSSEQAIVPNSPASRAGLEPGDLITAVDGQTISLDRGVHRQGRGGFRRADDHADRPARRSDQADQGHARQAAGQGADGLSHRSGSAVESVPPLVGRHGYVSELAIAAARSSVRSISS